MKYVLIGFLGFWIGAFTQFCVDYNAFEKKGRGFADAIHGLVTAATLVLLGILLVQGIVLAWQR